MVNKIPVKFFDEGDTSMVSVDGFHYKLSDGYQRSNFGSLVEHGRLGEAKERATGDNDGGRVYLCGGEAPIMHCVAFWLEFERVHNRSLTLWIKTEAGDHITFLQE